MAGHTVSDTNRRGSRWRIVVWSTAAALLLVPLVAMQFTDEVNWSVADFLVFGALLAGAGGTFDLAARVTRNTAYRAAVAVALVAAFLLVWANGAVGIIGSEDNPANLMFGGVLVVGIVGAAVARLRARGMARALVVTALAQALVAVIAATSGAGDIFVATAFFGSLWLASAWLFRRAALQQAAASAVR